MRGMGAGNRNTTLPVSKWDVRIRENKRRRNAEMRKHVLQLVFAAGFICIIIFGINSIVSRAGDVKEEDISFKYYKNICVEQGETLYSIAGMYADKAHYETVDAYIEEVVYMNHLKSADEISEGYYLIIPYYSNEWL